MSLREIVFHPVVLHRRSRLLFLWFVVSSVVASAILWWGLQNLLNDAATATTTAPFASKIFFRPFFRALVVLTSALFATVVTAGGLIGPVHRIEEWLSGRTKGASSRALRVRPGDPFETLIRLLNEMHQRSSGAVVKRKPRVRTPVAKTPRAPKLRAL